MVGTYIQKHTKGMCKKCTKGENMSKENPCLNCDHICDSLYNEDGECWGSLTHEQREALAKSITSPKPLPKEDHDQKTTTG